MLMYWISFEEFNRPLDSFLLRSREGLVRGRMPLLSVGRFLITTRIDELESYFVWSNFCREIERPSAEDSLKWPPDYFSFRNIGPFRFAKDQYVKAIIDCMP